MRPSEWGRVGHILNLCNADLLTKTILLQAKRGTRNPNLQVVIMHASHVRSHHFVWTKNERNSMNAIWSLAVGSSHSQSTALELKRFHLASLLLALRNLWLFLVFNNVLTSLTLYFSLYIKDKSAEMRKKGRKERKSLWYKIVSTETVRFVLKRFFWKIRIFFWFKVKESDPRYDSL